MSFFIEATPITLTLQYDGNGFTLVSYTPSSAQTDLSPGQFLGTEPRIAWNVTGSATATVIFTGPGGGSVDFTSNTPSAATITCQQPNDQFLVSYGGQVSPDSCEFEPMQGLQGGGGPRVILLASTKPVPDDLKPGGSDGSEKP